MTAAKIPSLYVHVPFCASICYYCDFFRQVYRKETADAWLNALEYELLHADINEGIETIYIGGGTPSSLSESQLDRLLSLLDPYKNKISEYTVEVNPETVTQAKIDLLLKHGVNRVSIGLQSHDAALLKKLNRNHSFENVSRLVNQFSACGISNISLDLMYSLPTQTMESLQRSTELAVSLNPSHLSLYSLTIEENSVFGKQGVRPLDEDTEADMYEWICSYLTDHGYDHYEISNFARDGKESLHNTRIWEYDDFYGFGCGASGKDEKGRYDHPGTLKQYLADPAARTYTYLSKEERMYETVMMGLRLSRGISRTRFRKMYGIDLTEVYPETIASLCREGMLILTEDRLFCSAHGFELLNTVLVRFMEEADL
ncbi:MAG: radical SAM family heme chaperone HemW [Solobacterium sp.]|nr:radical SAM family heme chaperone HemW [Solobacterium sp.]